MDKKIKTVLLIIAILSVIILITLSVILYKMNKDESQEPNVTGTEYYGESEDTLEGYYPRGLTSLTKKYEGDLENTEIQEATSSFIRMVFEINDHKNDESFYKENENIFIELGITNENEYNAIKKKIEDLNEEELEYKSAKFDTNTISTEGNYYTVDLIIELKDGKQLVFKEKFQIDYNSREKVFMFN